MRHVNRISGGYFSFNHPAKNCPYCTDYTFTRAKANRKYVLVAKFIFDNPGCTRLEILRGVWPELKDRTDDSLRGQQATMFSQALYHDLIDYRIEDHTGRYYLGSLGWKILKALTLI